MNLTLDIALPVLASEAQPPALATPRNGAQVLIQTLLELGVDTVFGYPGGAVLPLYDALHGEPRLRHVLVRHEQAAVHAAEGYARTTGRVGVVFVTSLGERWPLLPGRARCGRGELLSNDPRGPRARRGVAGQEQAVQR